MGLLMVLGLLRMQCPFCRERGIVKGNQQFGIWLECYTCGVVHGGGRWGLEMIRDAWGDECDDPTESLKSS
jgi:ribosomal protein L37AE/L43A